ncbi:hypothetical protein [Neisseria weixii]|uniref:hypothetical protein n=1 Tax=Neisseria weixii TaxID=1853276 RepID=UPI000BB7EF2E|nr:hypothetical protein [Neisseria weixii]ATD65780.1 hypothetical protein CGZ65_11895 [Neisseria weixii]
MQNAFKSLHIQNRRHFRVGGNDGLLGFYWCFSRLCGGLRPSERNIFQAAFELLFFNVVIIALKNHFKINTSLPTFAIFSLKPIFFKTSSRQFENKSRLS